VVVGVVVGAVHTTVTLSSTNIRPQKNVLYAALFVMVMECAPSAMDKSTV
jgi:uncharacterized membrane protein YqjE